MTNKTLIVAGATALVAASADAAVVTSWNFNGGSRASTNARGAAVVNLSTITTDFSTGSAFDTAAGVNRSLRMAGFSSSASLSGRQGVQFRADTTGFDFIGVSFAMAGHAKSSRWGQFQYSVNGGTSYTTVGLANSGRFRLNADGSFRRYVFSLSLFDGVGENSNFRFRIVSVMDPATGKMMGANASALASSAFWRLDRVVVGGTSIQSNSTAPAPGAIALLAAAGMVRVTRRRA